MGKKLVIKGADFSGNGFTYELVKKEVTALFDSSGTQITDINDYVSTKGCYAYENTSGKLAGASGGGAFCISTTPASEGALSGDFVTVEDYTDAEITTVNNLSPQSIIAGGAILFFLDSSKNIIGGFSTGQSSKGCTNEGASDTQRTLKMTIPEGSVYCVATLYVTSSNSTDRASALSAFKITLSKKNVIK